jgi:hypothetical protein
MNDAEKVLHDFRPGVYPGVDLLLNHLVDAHDVPRDRALASNLGLLHRLVHRVPEDDR